MNSIYLLILFLCIFLSFLIIFLYHLHTLRIMHRLEYMINAAIDGTFIEQTFDESRISSLESNFAKYLSAAETSRKNIAEEKNNIKTLISDISCFQYFIIFRIIVRTGSVPCIKRIHIFSERTGGKAEFSYYFPC